MPSWGGGGAGALGGAAAGSALGPIGAGIGGLVGGLAGLFGGQKKEKIRPQSLLRPEQEELYNQAINAGLQPGAGGAFGNSADYYRNLLSDNSQDLQAFAAPELRRYRQEIMPEISEQFAGMGSGGLGSSGFRNAQTQGAVDLAERLGAIRANLRQQGAAGLQNIGQLGLGRFSENVRNTPQPGFAENLFEGIGSALPSAFLSQYKKTNTSPYQGSNVSASPKISPAGGFGLPNFLQR